MTQKGITQGIRANGSTSKTLQGEFGELHLETPRDRNGSFEPKIIGKGQKRFEGFDAKIISMYARGMSVRQLQQHLEEMYGVEVSATLISNVVDGIVDLVSGWQSRPLDRVYAVIWLDAIYVKIRESGHVVNKAIYVAIGLNMQGHKEALGLWTGKEGSNAEGAKFWLQVLTELNNRGVKDVYVVCVDGLTGFPDAIQTVFPKAEVKLCVVHQMHN